jgi:hypothetical protein
VSHGAVIELQHFDTIRGQVDAGDVRALRA